MILNFTIEQLEDLESIFTKYNDLIEVGSIIGQIYRDGMAIKILSHEQTKAIQEILKPTDNNHISASVRTRD